MANKDIKTLLADLDKIETDAKDKIAKIQDLKDLEDLKTKVLGRKSKLTNILKNIKNLDKESKKEFGSTANKLRVNLTNEFEQKTKNIQFKKLENISKEEAIDITLPGKANRQGTIHPLTQMLHRAEDIFYRMGFEVVYANEVDDDYHNFQTVNIPEGHPARDSWDTFWTKDGHIAITHTSSMQNRILSAKEPPIRAVVPGRSFRNEATDARHEHTFTQIEGIYVDKGITFADMLGTLKTFFSEFFEQDMDILFSPDFFPFVEPGGMISLTCILCNGDGCDVCKKTGWLEILGCGMIHPKVLEMAKLDPNVYSGFAWGFGLERLIMLKSNIEDVRHFFSGNLKFIRQF